MSESIADNCKVVSTFHVVVQNIFERHGVTVGEDIYQRLDENQVRELLCEIFTLCTEL